MATKLTLKLTNRAPKKPIKKLPDSLELPADATVEDAKVLIARQTGLGDFNRVGLFDPATKKTLKDRKALLRNEANVMSAGELVVKDLGTLSGPPNRVVRFKEVGLLTAGHRTPGCMAHRLCYRILRAHPLPRPHGPRPPVYLFHPALRLQE